MTDIESLKEIKIITSRNNQKKIQQLIKLLESENNSVSVSKIQESCNMGFEESKSIFKLLKSFDSSDSFAMALKMQIIHDKELSDSLEKMQLVMTGPDAGTNTIHTAGKIIEMISSAREEIIIVGYVFNNIKGQLDKLVESLIESAKRGVSIKIFFQGGIKMKPIKKTFDIVPDKYKPEFFSYSPKTKGSVLHAKIIICDDSVLVTSANLTGYAFEKNLEMGIFAKGEIAQNAYRILKNFIDIGLMVRKP